MTKDSNEDIYYDYITFTSWQVLYPIGWVDLVWINRMQINEWMDEWYNSENRFLNKFLPESLFLDLVIVLFFLQSEYVNTVWRITPKYYAA